MMGKNLEIWKYNMSRRENYLHEKVMHNAYRLLRVELVILKQMVIQASTWCVHAFDLSMPMIIMLTWKVKQCWTYNAEPTMLNLQYWTNNAELTILN